MLYTDSVWVTVGYISIFTNNTRNQCDVHCTYIYIYIQNTTHPSSVNQTASVRASSPLASIAFCRLAIVASHHSSIHISTYNRTRCNERYTYKHINMYIYIEISVHNSRDREINKGIVVSIYNESVKAISFYILLVEY